MSAAETLRTRSTGRRTLLYRVRRRGPSGEISGTRYYAQRPAAVERARRWKEAGYTVSVEVSAWTVGFRSDSRLTP